MKKTIQVNGLTINIKELTVSEIRTALKLEESEGNESQATDVVDMFLLDDISLPDIRRMTDLSKKQMETMPPSELKQVETACREVNADFFALRQKVIQYADLLSATENAPQPAATENG